MKNIEYVYLNGVRLDLLKSEVENGFTPSPATIIELIKYAKRYLFLSRCDSQIRLEIAESEDMGAGDVYLDKAIEDAMALDSGMSRLA